MRKIHLLYTLAGLAGICVPPAAFAQTSPGGDMQAPKLQPQGEQDTPLPAAIPGAGDQALPTSQSVAQQQSGDPTTDLFNAINAGDYNAAQDAISRGADLSAQNALGETPIDLSVALNRNSITFMLLAARNDAGGDEAADNAPAGTPAPSYAPTPVAKSHAVPVKLIERPAPASRRPPALTPTTAPGDNPGTPDSSAGFLGFGH